MNLTLHSQCTAGVALIRCQGRIVVGKEVELLLQEVKSIVWKRKNTSCS